MKYFLLIIAISVIPNLVMAQNSNSNEKRFGFALHSSINSEVNSILIIPGASFYSGKSQFELGIGFNPFFQKDQRIVSSEFNYKYFPNENKNKFNMYLMMSFSYVNQLRKTYYPATYQYFFLNGGYGFQISTLKRMYIGTNINIGTFTNSKSSENPYNEYYGNKNIFDEFELSLAWQLNVGYRFKEQRMNSNN